MQFEGLIYKMDALYADPVQYYLDMQNHTLNMNQLIGKDIRLIHDHNECLNCGKNLDIYQMGYCKKCFFLVPQAAPSVVNPELSTAHLGIEERNLEFEQKMHLQPHVVYLADSGGNKVGVTRASQMPTRWIDQGANLALPLAATPNRYEAGVIEKELKKHISDRTDYRKMLTDSAYSTDLTEVKKQLKDYLPEDSKKYYIEEDELVKINYPVDKYPHTVHSKNLKSDPVISGRLEGIKGQYLLLSGNNVVNLRAHEGYYIKLDVL